MSKNIDRWHEVSENMIKVRALLLWVKMPHIPVKPKRYDRKTTDQCGNRAQNDYYQFRHFG